MLGFPGGRQKPALFFQFSFRHHLMTALVIQVTIKGASDMEELVAEGQEALSWAGFSKKQGSQGDFVALALSSDGDPRRVLTPKTSDRCQSAQAGRRAHDEDLIGLKRTEPAWVRSDQLGDQGFKRRGLRAHRA